MTDKGVERNPSKKPVAYGFPASLAAIALVIAAAIGLFGSSWSHSSASKSLIELMSNVVPEVRAAMKGAENPLHIGLLLASQWIFAPIYMLLWMRRETPWSASVREALLVRRHEISLSKRLIAYSLFWALLSVWVLGSVGVINIPTFYNGLIFSEELSLRMLKNASKSTYSMVMIAWISPIVEVILFWLFLFCCANIRPLISSYRS